MLIHIGQNEFVDFKQCEMIINLFTVDQDTRKRILATLPELKKGDEYHAAIRTVDGRWIGSTLSPEALAQRGICHPFADAPYLKSEWKLSSQYRY
ncbi:MAG TPA: hypothetical protein DCG57_07340 [Candidatus Riflebacteria bacterium]|jgi:hypothetical protein|nr:MAG: hypothetical protein CVV41_07525 [Candidatus Riflebacteria bacterium HGW-Riflebacteria-1]HAE38438.1 hypothetical protein [Candidatus Riflebacteria bacterium]